MKNKWWQDRVVYQIYPRSFCDSNNDGVGDIAGIISKLDYLKSLGVGAVWLSPVYKSPNRDFGYDISDYCDVNPEFGSLKDMKKLFAESAKRDIKVIMDLVVNHTSDQHPWFQSALKDPTSPYRDYYIWQPPKVGDGDYALPNNWSSVFTGPAWTLDEASDEFYLHLFTKHQPDLNFDNPKVVEEVKNIMKFWLDMGAAGFRCDVINLIHKQSFENGRRRILSTGSEHYVSAPGSHALLRQFNSEVWQPYGAFTVGEAHQATIEDIKSFTKGDELTTAFSFEHMIPKVGYQADKVKRQLIRQQTQLDWPTVFFENHDGLRSVSRFGNDSKFHYESATMIATLNLTLRGTAFIYQGQEIAMTNAPFRNIGQIQDIITLSIYKIMLRYGIPSRLAFKLVMFVCRDHSRTPVQWTDEANGGFSQCEPWLMANPNYPLINVAQQMTDPQSVWHFYQHLLAVRQQTAAWRTGSINFLPSPKGVMIYDRQEKSNHYRIVVNMEGRARKLDLSLKGLVVSSNYQRKSCSRVDRLQPFEALVVELA